MGSLVEKLMRAGAAMGLAGCVSATDKPEIKETGTVRTSMPFFENVVEISAQVDYGKIGWDRAYFTAGTINGCDDPEIHLFYLRFESDLSDEKTRVIRIATHIYFKECVIKYLSKR